MCFFSLGLFLSVKPTILPHKREKNIIDFDEQKNMISVAYPPSRRGERGKVHYFSLIGQKSPRPGEIFGILKKYSPLREERKE